eukprot:scaffold7729_cov172-Amphora_coffeaeformis.AAC.4
MMLLASLIKKNTRPFWGLQQNVYARTGGLPPSLLCGKAKSPVTLSPPTKIIIIIQTNTERSPNFYRERERERMWVNCSMIIHHVLWHLVCESVNTCKVILMHTLPGLPWIAQTFTISDGRVKSAEASLVDDRRTNNRSPKTEVLFYNYGGIDKGTFLNVLSVFVPRWQGHKNDIPATQDGTTSGDVLGEKFLGSTTSTKFTTSCPVSGALWSWDRVY